MVTAIAIGTGSGSLKLEDLEILLNKRLQIESLPIAPAQVDCLLREQNLTVLVHYPKTALLSPQPVLTIVRQTLEEQQISPDLNLLSYVVIDGQKYSDGGEGLLLQSNDPENCQEDQMATETGLDKPTAQTMVAVIEQTTDELVPQFDHSNLKMLPQPPLLLRNAENLSPGEDTEGSWQEAKGGQLLKNLNLVAKAGIVLGVLLIGGYVGTRPCTFGKCPEISAARALAQEAEKSLDQTASIEELARARQQLVQSIKKLGLIPFWSKYHGEAANLVRIYQSRLEVLEEVEKALQSAAKAVSLAQNPPFPASQWQEIQQLWQQAIASLDGIPKDSEIYKFANTKIQEYQQISTIQTLEQQLETFTHSKIEEYQRNLAIIEDQLKAEEKATTSLKAAQEAANIAQARQNAAQSLSNWQLVQATWDIAIKRLREISPGTTTHQEAQKLLPLYQSELVAAKTRTNQEQFARKAYNQAIKQAELAKSSESINQWSAAVSQWRNALTYLKQVSPNSFQSLEAKPLVPAYTQALEKAQVRLKIAVKLDQARSDLEVTCSDANKICSYTVTDKVIRVVLTPIYMENIFQSALRAKGEYNSQTQLELLAHISTLERALITINQKTGIPIEVYNPEGAVILTYGAGQ